jgi:glycosyltransferase involved in cell wall biosynthesis
LASCAKPSAPLEHDTRALFPIRETGMKISVVTVAYNAARTIADTLASVAGQSHKDVEHIVIDGASKDNTSALVQSLQRKGGQFVSERDKGLYDAMNKGIARATGDIIGLLNADDIYADADVLSRIADAFLHHGADAVLGDIGYFRDGFPDRIVRRYNSGRFRPGRVRWGWMPAHPAMFLTRDAYARIGNYRTDYKIAADFEFVVRAFAKAKLNYVHVPDMLVKMRLGGVSTSGLGAAWTINTESVRACRENGIYSNVPMMMTKYPFKIAEFFQ